MKDTSVFQTDVKYVFDFLRYAEDKKALYELVTKESYYRMMEEDAFDVVSLYANLKGLIEKENYNEAGGRKDMCKAIRDLMEDSKIEGIEQGIERGIRVLIETCKSFDASWDVTIEKLQQQFELSRDVAGEKMEKYW